MSPSIQTSSLNTQPKKSRILIWIWKWILESRAMPKCIGCVLLLVYITSPSLLTTGWSFHEKCCKLSQNAPACNVKESGKMMPNPHLESGQHQNLNTSTGPALVHAHHVGRHSLMHSQTDTHTHTQTHTMCSQYLICLCREARKKIKQQNTQQFNFTMLKSN